jgi:predicted alpha/beta hydrolase family esterase
VHWLDHAATIALSKLPAQRRVFRDGWGDPDTIEWFREIAATTAQVPNVDVAAGPSRTSKGLVLRDLTFDSPLERLPESTRRASARIVEPPEGADRVVILMPAWNDEGWRTRGMLVPLLAERGIASVMIEAPFYGERRNGYAPPIAVVSDFGLMGRGAVVDARVLADHFRGLGCDVGVSGYSMGGNLSAFVAATSPFPIAAAPLAAAHSPAAPFIDGVLRVSVAWDALGGETEEVVERLREYLLLASVLRFEAPPHTRAAVMVAGTVDGFIPTAAVQLLHRHWPGSRLDWVHAGHGSLIWRKKDRLVQAIVDSFDRLEAFERN